MLRWFAVADDARVLPLVRYCLARMNHVGTGIFADPAAQNLVVINPQFENFGERDIQQAGPDTADDTRVGYQQAVVVVE